MGLLGDWLWFAGWGVVVLLVLSRCVFGSFIPWRPCCSSVSSSGIDWMYADAVVVLRALAFGGWGLRRAVVCRLELLSVILTLSRFGAVVRWGGGVLGKVRFDGYASV